MCRLCMTGSRLTAAPGKTATTMPSESCLPPARSTGLTRSASPFAVGTLSVPTGARPPGSLTGISLTFGRPITDGAHTSVEWWAILRSDQETATLSGALILRFGPDGRCEELREYWHLDEDHAIPRARRLGTVAHRGTGTPRAGRSVRVVRFWFTPSRVTPRTGTR